MRLLLCDARRLGFLAKTFDLGLDLGFGLGARAGDFGSERTGGGCLGRLLGFAGGGLLVEAASVFRLDAHAFHFRLDLRVGFLTDAGELRRDARVSLRFDARDFFGERFRRLLRGGRLHRFGFGLNARHLFGSLCFGFGHHARHLFLPGRFGLGLDAGELFLSRGFGLRLHARDLFLSRRFGFGLGAIELLGERKLRIGLDAAELVRQLGFGFCAHACELGVQRFAGLGLGGDTRFGDGRVTRGGGLALDPRQFRGALLGGLGAHAFKFCGEFGVGHRLHEGDLRRVHFRVYRIVGRRAALARWGLRDVIDRDEELVALFFGVQ